METAFMGEHLLPGKVGHLMVVIAFIAAIFSAFCYVMDERNRAAYKEGTGWKKIGRIAFMTHAVAVLGIISALFYIILNHYFEYHYAWQHSSKSLPVYYQLACFWEGQEGSFLLWMVWHVLLGMVLLRTSGRWESPVIGVMMLVQFFLGSMLLGIYVAGYKIGSSPFILLREVMMDAPVFRRPDYLSFIEDGAGLNPLLQNYWMVIHPPTLFLGFASATVPFAYVLAGLFRRQYDACASVMHPWVIFSVFILAAGILMGAAWAYVALSFGGYWAWDPVENASLVPWLTLAGGLHTLMAYRKSGYGLRASFLLLIITFLLVLYATFLTRSGILGDSSVHSFTDLGMSGQLVIYLSAFVILSAVMLSRRWRSIPAPPGEEGISSREFWMFIGALLFLVSCIQITFDTSRPVINKIFGTNLAPPAEVIFHYNRWQLPITGIIGLLGSIGLYLKFRQSDLRKMFLKILPPLLLSVALTALAGYMNKVQAWHYLAFLFAGIFMFIANTYYFFTVLSGKLKLSGASVSHAGFGLLLAGILLSSHGKEVISLNTMGIDYGEGFDDQNKRENILLYRNIPLRMGPYSVTYEGDSTVPPNTYFKVRYLRSDEATGRARESFYLYPYAQINPKMGLVASPDTRHYFLNDLFTYVSSIPDKEKRTITRDENFIRHRVGAGDSVFTSNACVILDSISRFPERKGFSFKEGDLWAGACLRIIYPGGEAHTSKPVYLVRGRQEHFLETGIPELGLRFIFTKIFTEDGSVEIGIMEDTPVKDYIIMKAVVFPFINLVWAGSIIMLAGIFLSLRKRIIKK